MVAHVWVLVPTLKPTLQFWWASVYVYLRTLFKIFIYFSVHSRFCSSRSSWKRWRKERRTSTSSLRIGCRTQAMEQGICNSWRPNYIRPEYLKSDNATSTGIVACIIWVSGELELFLVTENENEGAFKKAWKFKPATCWELLTDLKFTRVIKLLLLEINSWARTHSCTASSVTKDLWQRQCGVLQSAWLVHTCLGRAYLCESQCVLLLWDCPCVRQYLRVHELISINNKGKLLPFSAIHIFSRVLPVVSFWLHSICLIKSVCYQLENFTGGHFRSTFWCSTCL